LFEEFSYSEGGDPLAATFADYLLPALHEVPAPEVLLREDYTSPLNPLGIKGAGESGITAVGATIASAIDDAIGRPGAVRQLPITPQRLRRLLGGRPRHPEVRAKRASKDDSPGRRPSRAASRPPQGDGN
jgi:CO/xanthine dehydrogenase Mo-binding subunit